MPTAIYVLVWSVDIRAYEYELLVVLCIICFIVPYSVFESFYKQYTLRYVSLIRFAGSLQASESKR